MQCYPHYCGNFVTAVTVTAVTKASNQGRLSYLFRKTVGSLFQAAVCRKLSVSGHRFVVGSKGSAERNRHCRSEIREMPGRSG